MIRQFPYGDPKGVSILRGFNRREWVNGDIFKFHNYDEYFQKAAIAQRKRTAANGERLFIGARSPAARGVSEQVVLKQVISKAGYFEEGRWKHFQ